MLNLEINMVRKKMSFRAIRKGKPVKVEFEVHKKPKKMKKIPIQVRLPEGTIAQTDESMKTGKFMNRSDFIRDSLRKADEKKIYRFTHVDTAALIFIIAVVIIGSISVYNGIQDQVPDRYVWIVFLFAILSVRFEVKYVKEAR